MNVKQLHLSRLAPALEMPMRATYSRMLVVAALILAVASSLCVVCLINPSTRMSIDNISSLAVQTLLTSPMRVSQSPKLTEHAGNNVGELVPLKTEYFVEASPTPNAPELISPSQTPVQQGNNSGELISPSQTPVPSPSLGQLVSPSPSPGELVSPHSSPTVTPSASEVVVTPPRGSVPASSAQRADSSLVPQEEVSASPNSLSALSLSAINATSLAAICALGAGLVIVLAVVLKNRRKR